MPNYLRARTPGGTYFFTVVTYRRQPILCLDQSLNIMRHVIRSVIKSRPFHIDSWIVLPDHMHSLWTLPEGDIDYSTRWALIKKEFTKLVTPILYDNVEPGLSRVRHREGMIWQRRFWEHRIRDEADYRDHMDYVHFNSVKHGLAKSPKDWPWSTFHFCVAQGIYDPSWGSGGVALPDSIGGE